MLCLRWYLNVKLSSRDLVQIMAERGIALAHTTILRWVQRYVPDFEKRWNQHARPVGDSWRVDETYIKIKGEWVYLYRAVDKAGRAVDFLLSKRRSRTSVRATPTRCFSPPESRLGRRAISGSMRNMRAISMTRRSTSCAGNRRALKGMAMFSKRPLDAGRAHSSRKSWRNRAPGANIDAMAVGQDHALGYRLESSQYADGRRLAAARGPRRHKNSPSSTTRFRSATACVPSA